MHGKVCLVTGANRGIGRETALGLARLGATVLVVCRTRESAEQTRAEIGAATGNTNIQGYFADFAVQTHLAELMAEMTALHGEPIGADSGRPQQMMVLAMGKHGGGDMHDVAQVFPRAHAARLEHFRRKQNRPQCSIFLFSRNSGRKTAAHFCWNCSSRIRPGRPAPPPRGLWDRL